MLRYLLPLVMIGLASPASADIIRLQCLSVVSVPSSELWENFDISLNDGIIYWSVVLHDRSFELNYRITRATDAEIIAAHPKGGGLSIRLDRYNSTVETVGTADTKRNCRLKTRQF
ncbi:hypothetical protein [Aureimonas frigidaquae]|uniref:hypothetical protein n=1 Tax=Aureimonas frigidaquae TaxID=424757 RepID=UPI000781D998|nr:hypothetical protein [Aureimonas frigidaquae]